MSDLHALLQRLPVAMLRSQGLLLLEHAEQQTTSVSDHIAVMGLTCLVIAACSPEHRTYTFAGKSELSIHKEDCWMLASVMTALR